MVQEKRQVVLSQAWMSMAVVDSMIYCFLMFRLICAYPSLLGMLAMTKTKDGMAPHKRGGETGRKRWRQGKEKKRDEATEMKELVLSRQSVADSVR